MPERYFKRDVALNFQSLSVWGFNFA